MPTGRITFHDSATGFGSARTEEGEEVHVTASADPGPAPDVTSTSGPAPDVTSTSVPAPARRRRRTPTPDPLLAAAGDTARAALIAVTDEAWVGEPLGVTADDDRLMTHLFEAHLPGYAGWRWYSTIARAPRSKHVTVCETGLLAGEDAVVAPPWVPYAERVSEEEREHLTAVAEGRVPDEL